MQEVPKTAFPGRLGVAADGMDGDKVEHERVNGTLHVARARHDHERVLDEPVPAPSDGEVAQGQEEVARVRHVALNRLSPHVYPPAEHEDARHQLVDDAQQLLVLEQLVRQAAERHVFAAELPRVLHRRHVLAIVLHAFPLAGRMQDKGHVDKLHLVSSLLLSQVGKHAGRQTPVQDAIHAHQAN